MSKHFIVQEFSHVTSSELQNSCDGLFSFLNRGSNWGSEELSNLPMVKYTESGSVSHKPNILDC